MDSRITARSLSHALGGWRTREPAYEALADGIRLLCLDNRLAPRTTLPAERDLAGVLQVSRSTVAAAYRSLRASAHIESTRGSGSMTLPLGRRDFGRVAADPESIDLQQASPAAWPGLAGVMTEVAGDAASLLSRPGYEIVGTAGLRAAIAARYTDRGVPTTPDEVMVTTGAQSAIHLLAVALLRRGDRVLIETPTYPHAADGFRAAGGRLVGVPVTTTDGWDLDRARGAFERTRPIVAYLMPTFQNPTGRTMTAADEETIAQEAHRAGTTLVLDETTAELSIDRARTDLAFRTADVVRIGSLGKTVWGGLRVGWIRGSVDLIKRVLAVRPAHDLGTPEFEQAVAARLFAHLPEILDQRERLLREGHDVLVEALGRHLPGWTVPRVHGGVSLWVELDAPLSSALVMAARSHGLYLSAGPRFSVDGGHDRHLRIPFTAPVDELSRAVDVLARTWPSVLTAAPTVIDRTLEPVV